MSPSSKRIIHEALGAHAASGHSRTDGEPFWDVFLSYARKDDKDFIERLRDDLVAHGKSVWWDREAMESRGRGFPLEIRDAIWRSDRVVVINSRATL